MRVLIDLDVLIGAYDIACKVQEFTGNVIASGDYVQSDVTDKMNADAFVKEVEFIASRLKKRSKKLAMLNQ